MALDWKWLFILPDQGIAAVNDLAVPVDRQVEFTLIASSVMNAFHIPATTGMIYAMETRVHGVFNAAGDYQGLSSQVSGAGFSGMRFKTHAVDQAGFDAWVAAAKTSGQSLDRARYLTLATRSQQEKPACFATVAPDLFARVVNLCVEPGKMCMAEMAALDAKGGAGLAGAWNVLTHGRNGLSAQTVLGPHRIMVTSICTPADAVAMFGTAPHSFAAIADPSPQHGHGVAQPPGRCGASPAKTLATAQPLSTSDL